MRHCVVMGYMKYAIPSFQVVVLSQNCAHAFMIADYLRVVFAFASFYYMQTDPWLASSLYIISGLLDAIDGHLARMLNQGSIHVV